MNIPSIVGYALAAYATLMTSGSIIQNFSERVNSQEELDKIVDEEAQKLGLDPARIVANLSESPDVRGARSRVAGFDLKTQELLSYENVDASKGIIPIRLLTLKKGWGANRGTVRHELYHLCNHLPRQRNLLKYWFYEEPTAILYAVTGIRL
ncbi:hypothetical protein KY337_00395 [Candidatus Woesearchaeota archaeon]|nr:hypothetical protein [Candidatus Woesearchaeota archaeon]